MERAAIKTKVNRENKINLGVYCNECVNKIDLYNTVDSKTIIGE